MNKTIKKNRYNTKSICNKSNSYIKLLTDAATLSKKNRLSQSSTPYYKYKTYISTLAKQFIKLPPPLNETLLPKSANFLSNSAIEPSVFLIFLSISKSPKGLRALFHLNNSIFSAYFGKIIFLSGCAFFIFSNSS